MLKEGNGESMITKCPFPCIVKSDYGICVAGRCMNSDYRSLWNGDKLDIQKMKQYKGQIKPEENCDVQGEMEI